jgi:hypothetical protein
MEGVAVGGGWMEDGGWVEQRQGWDKRCVRLVSAGQKLRWWVGGAEASRVG